jgi:hypothetical protein
MECGRRGRKEVGSRCAQPLSKELVECIKQTLEGELLLLVGHLEFVLNRCFLNALLLNDLGSLLSIPELLLKFRTAVMNCTLMFGREAGLLWRAHPRGAYHHQ